MFALKLLAGAYALSEDQIESVQWQDDQAEDSALVKPAAWDGDESALLTIPAKQLGEFGGHANNEESGPEPEPQDLVRDGTEDEPDYYGVTKTEAHKDFGRLWVRRAWRRCFFFDCHGALRFVWSDFHCGCGNSDKLWRYCVRLQNRLSWRRYWNYYRFMRCGSFWPFGGPGAWWNRFGPCGNCVWCRHHPRPIIVVKKVAVPCVSGNCQQPAPASWAPQGAISQDSDKIADSGMAQNYGGAADFQAGQMSQGGAFGGMSAGSDSVTQDAASGFSGVSGAMPNAFGQGAGAFGQGGFGQGGFDQGGFGQGGMGQGGFGQGGFGQGPVQI